MNGCSFARYRFRSDLDSSSWSSRRQWLFEKGKLIMKTPNDSPKSSRKSKWDPAILALLQHATREKAAEAAGINVTTLYRWQKDAEFKKALLEVRRDVFGQAMGRLQQASNTAVDTLIKIMNDPDAAVGGRVQACNAYSNSPGRAWSWMICKCKSRIYRVGGAP
jgi:hypothetical protein